MHTKADLNVNVFIAPAIGDAERLQMQVNRIISKAGMHSFFLNSESETEKEIQKRLQEANCSIHLLGTQYGNLCCNDKGLSIDEYIFNQAQLIASQNDSNYRMFIWQPSYLQHKMQDDRQRKFANRVRNNIVRNMIFSNQDSPIQFIEDIRSIMTIEKSIKFDTKETDIFFIYSEPDQSEAKSISDLLKDVAKVENLEIILDTEVNYSELVRQQTEKSKLLVVYFKRMGDWALPFTQQVWKSVGGASSSAEILLVGDESYENNSKYLFDAPKVKSLLLSEDLIPLEIKVELDKSGNQ